MKPERLDPSFLLEHIRQNTKFDADLIEQIISEWKAYKDTGLEPEDLKRAFNEDAILKLAGQALSTTADRLRQLADCDKDGRCAVLPCKVGDTVYLTILGYVEETKVRTFFVGHPSYSYVPFDPRYYMVRLEKYDIPLRNFGKTVFLTRAEAEAALEKEAESEH